MVSETIYLKRSRVVSVNGGTCHIYLPKELEGKEVIGVVVRAESDEKYV